MSKPEILLYPLQAKINQLYDETVSLLANTGKRGLSYARYRAIEYLKPEHKRDYMRPEFFTQQLAAIMKTLLIKRLDSSFHAFHRSLTRFTAAAGAMLKMIADDRIIIAPERQVTEYVLEDREDELLEMLQNEQSTDPGIKIVRRNDFEVGFVADLEKDHALLTDMQEKWQRVIENGQDPKWDKLLSVLESDLFDKRRNPERKLVIFSESLDTTDYLAARFHNSGYDKTLAVNSGNRKQPARRNQRQLRCKCRARPAALQLRRPHHHRGVERGSEPAPRQYHPQLRHPLERHPLDATHRAPEPYRRSSAKNSRLQFLSHRTGGR